MQGCPGKGKMCVTFRPHPIEIPRELWAHERKQIFFERNNFHGLSSSSNQSLQTTLKHLYFTMKTPDRNILRVLSACSFIYSFKKYLSAFYVLDSVKEVRDTEMNHNLFLCPQEL